MSVTAPPPSTADPYLPDSGDESYGVDHYDLVLTYRPSSNRLEGEATIEATAREPLGRVSLDLAGLTVTKVTVDGRRAKKYSQRKRKLLVTLTDPKAAGESIRLVISYAGSPRPVRSLWGDVGWEELSEGALVAGQPNGAPSWFPCNDRPSDKATYRIAVTADAPFTVIANGVLAERRARASFVTWVYEQGEPMATYLATVQIGRYDRRVLGDVTAGATGIIQQIARPARLTDAAAHDFGRHDAMMRCFTKSFGDYPFGTYTVVVTDDPLEIPLEAQGLSIFGANHIDGRRSYERLIAHELAHQWFGNSLSVSRWSDIWLNEGFACYAEWLWSEASGGAATHVLAGRHWARLDDLDQDLVLIDPGAERMFDDRVYKRGALTLHALRCFVGDAAFFDLIRSWAAEHRYGSVTSAEFVEHAADGTHGVRALLSRWLTEPKLPPLPPASTGVGRRRA
jgi:aminopeptidase N